MSNSEVSPYLIDSREVDQATWNAVRFIARTAFTNAILHPDTPTKSTGLRTHDEVDTFVGWNSNADYFSYMANPNELVGTHLRSNQKFWGARLGLATVNDDIAGFVYAADNTSGKNRMIRWAKHHHNPTNHLWIGQIAVLPKYQNNENFQIGTTLARTILADAPLKQPVSAYVYPNEIPGIKEMLLKHGFTEGETTLEQPFGPGTRATPQVRMHADSVGSVLSTLR